MASLKFYLDKPRKDSGLCAVYLRYKCVAGSTTFYTSFAVLPNRWDKKAQRFKGTTLTVQKDNGGLVSFRQNIEQAVEAMRKASGSLLDPHPSLVRRQLSPEASAPTLTPTLATGLDETTATCLPSLINQVMRLRRGELRTGTLGEYGKVVPTLARYCPLEDQRWQLPNLTGEFLEGWRQSLVLSKQLGGMGHDNQTANNRLAVIAAVLNYARTQFKTYRLAIDEELLLVCRRKFKVLKQARQYLSEAELLQFYQAELPAEGRGTHYLVRDVYCLSWLTSLRQSDILSLGREHLVLDDNQLPVALDITSIKSSQAALVPLNALARQILGRWLSRQGLRLPQQLRRYAWPSDKVFPQLGRSRHSIIKRLFELVSTEPELQKLTEPVEVVRGRGAEQVRSVVPRWELLTLHTARHGFGNLMAEKNVPIEDAQLLMGHADLESTKLYYHRPKDKALQRARLVLDTIALPATSATETAAAESKKTESP